MGWPILEDADLRQRAQWLRLPEWRRLEPPPVELAMRKAPYAVACIRNIAYHAILTSNALSLSFPDRQDCRDEMYPNGFKGTTTTTCLAA